LLRRTICGLTTQNYNRVFLQLTRGLRRDGITLAALVKLLLGQTGETVEWPSDAKFKEAWLSRSAYDLGNAKLVYILKRLSESYLSSKMEPLPFSKQPTVEHILPQSWIEHWPLPDGTSGLDAVELWSVNDGDPRAEATATRNSQLQTMGNLAIIMQALNSSQSNSAWRDKKAALLEHSLLPINQQLQTEEVWDENAIRRRGESLFNRALTLWRRW
jgi:hypothetical protein